MAGVREEEVDYESDPEEAKLSLKLRRRVASDDEDEGGGRSGEGRSGEGREKLVRSIDLEGESEEEGAPAEYYDEDEEGIEEEVEEEYLEVEDELGEEEVEYEDEEGGGVEVQVVVVQEGEGGEEVGREKLAVKSSEVNGWETNSLDEKGKDDIDNKQQIEEEKKENEPYAVPTAGAFYMHDDRFRENVGGRNRRTLGRKLWESKDDRKWGHDKFEEVTIQETQYDEGRRTSRGRSRGRGRGKGALRGSSRGNRPRTYSDNNYENNNNNQNDAPKIVRGRGPRRYQPSFKNNNDVHLAQDKQSGKSFEKASHTSSGRATILTSNGESDTVSAKKQVFASSLNYASPPFYPSSSSNKEIATTQRKNVQSNKNGLLPAAAENFRVAQPNTMQRGKNIVDSIGKDKLYIDNSTSGITGKPSNTSQFPQSGSSSVNSSHSQHFRAQGRGINALPVSTYQPTVANNRVSPVYSVPRNSVQSRVQPYVQASGMRLGQRAGSVSQPSSPPKAAIPVNSLDSGELETSSESSKLKTALVGKGKANVQGSGRGSFLYGGAQLIGGSGNMGTGRGDQNIPGTPAFLPVMQFGGQHPGGIPAVGMAFPGYVGQPQLGMGNSEMTWLPVLAGAAGALGASYCSPYIPVDGAYHPRPSGQTSALTAASSKENNLKPGTEWKPSQRPELANEEFGQRQKNIRRYTEMKFDQRST